MGPMPEDARVMLRRIAVSIVVLFPLGISCVEEEPDPSGPPICSDCDNADSCPGDQPNQNPLETCDEVDATCYYCGPVMRRYVCEENANGDLFWQDAGESDMCPPPPEPMTGDATD